MRLRSRLSVGLAVGAAGLAAAAIVIPSVGTNRAAAAVAATPAAATSVVPYIVSIHGGP